MLGTVPAVAVLYTNKEVAGEVTGAASFVAVKATLGIINPFLSAAGSPAVLISNFAELFGEFVPIPTLPCANTLIDKIIHIYIYIIYSIVKSFS